MRKAFALVFGLAIVSTIIAAQAQNNPTERRNSDLMIVTSDVRVGTHLMPAGTYRLICDHKKISFIRISDNRIEYEAVCKGKELAAPAETTTMHTNIGKDGQRYVVKLLLRGSQTEHVFDQP